MHRQPFAKHASFDLIYRNLASRTALPLTLPHLKELALLNKQILLATLVALFAATSKTWLSADESPAKKTPGTEVEFKPLFDGKSTQGWEGSKEYFRIEEGAIVAGTLKAKIPNNEFLCTKNKYGDFELILEVKLRGEGNNAGVQFRSERIEDSHEVRGYQCDAGAAFDRQVWGALYDESRRRKMLAEGPKEKLDDWVRQDDWNELRILARGDRIQLFLNGKATVDFVETADEKTVPRNGIIGLQIHSGPPTEALYRNIRIREL